MPFYSCIFRSLAPATDALALAEDEDRGELSSLVLISRIVRENACLWLANNLKPIAEGIKQQQEKLGPQAKVSIEAWRLMPHLRLSFSLIVEMAAAADLADESIVGIKLYDHLMDQFWLCLKALDDSKESDKAQYLNRYAWDILMLIREKDKPIFGQRICSPIVWLLWGQALIKIGRNYLIPKNRGKESQTSFEHHKALYNHCLDLAATKFEKCQRLVAQIVRNAPSSEPRAALSRVSAECASALGYILLSKGREATDCQELRRRLLSDAVRHLRRAYTLDAHSSAVYNLACVAALANLPLECRKYLQRSAQQGVLPPLIHVFHDPDLDPVRSHSWFATFMESVPNEKPSSDSSWIYSDLVDVTLIQSTFAMPEPAANVDYAAHAMLHIPKPHDTTFAGTANTKMMSHLPTVHAASTSPPKPSADNASTSPPNADPQPKTGQSKFGDLTESMYFDEELNKLQASLTRDGFSRSTVVSMLKELHKQKKADKAQHERFEAAHARLMFRLEAAGMKQKSVIPGDGNCQFHSISDQLFDSLEQSAWVRDQIVSWLKTHGDWELPENGAQLQAFAMDDWESYCNHMAKPGIWGDHLTLTAAAQRFGVRIVLFSSIEDNHYVTEYVPTVITSPKVLYLCHYAEYHYGSVCHKTEEELSQEADAAKNDEITRSVAQGAADLPPPSSDQSDGTQHHNVNLPLVQDQE